MKKHVFLALGLSLLWGTVSAQVPPSATFDLSVVNISQDNKDAVSQGAQPGDVLRYQLILDSPTEDVVGFSTSVDVTRVLDVAEIIDTGLGELNGNLLTYPSVDKQAPCTQEYTFFARIKPDCGNVKMLSLTWENQTVQVALHCGLVPTGPDTWGTFIFGFFAAVALFLSWIFSRKAEA